VASLGLFGTFGGSEDPCGAFFIIDQALDILRSPIKAGPVTKIGEEGLQKSFDADWRLVL